MKLLMPSLLLSQVLAAPIGFDQALRLADRDEAALEAGAKAVLVQSQDAALQAAAASCVALAPGQLPAFTIVLALDSSGRATRSWRNSDVPMVLCVERELRNGSYGSSGRDESFVSFVVSFTR